MSYGAWGDANVQAVQQALPRELAYTTVQTMLQHPARQRQSKTAKRDRAYFYTPWSARARWHAMP